MLFSYIRFDDEQVTCSYFFLFTASTFVCHDNFEPMVLCGNCLAQMCEVLIKYNS